MHIRCFQLSDHQKVTHLMEDVLSKECYEETLKVLVRQISWESDLVLVAEVDKQLAGLLIATIDNHTGYVYRLAVRKKYRCQGIGSQLVSCINTRFNQRKVRKVLFAEDQHNVILRPFYGSLGIEPVPIASMNPPLSIIAG